MWFILPQRRGGAEKTKYILCDEIIKKAFLCGESRRKILHYRSG
jgi:hypothetical protein